MAVGRGVVIRKTDIVAIPADAEIGRDVVVEKAGLTIIYDRELAPHVDDVVTAYREDRRVRVTRIERDGTVTEGGPELFSGGGAADVD